MYHYFCPISCCNFSELIGQGIWNIFSKRGQTQYGQTNGQTDGQTDGRTDGQTNGETNGLTDGRTDGQTDG